MKPEEIEEWLWAARDEARKAVAPDDDYWWPTSNNENDSATAWATAFFITAACKKLGAPTGRGIWMAKHGEDSGRMRVLNSLWTSQAGQHEARQVLVDFSVNDWAQASPLLLTAESEVSATKDVGDWRLGDEHDYAWDFLKLLVVPSPLRLFFARVGSVEREGPDRIAELTATLGKLVGTHKMLLRDGDELAAVIVPLTKEKAYEGETRVLWTEGRELKQTKVAKTPRVWKGKK